MLGDPSSKSEFLKNMLVGPFWEGLWRQDFGCKLTLISLLIQSTMFSYVLYEMYLIAHDFLTLWVNSSFSYLVMCFVVFPLLCSRLITCWGEGRERRSSAAELHWPPVEVGLQLWLFKESYCWSVLVCDLTHSRARGVASVRRGNTFLRHKLATPLGRSFVRSFFSCLLLYWFFDLVSLKFWGLVISPLSFLGWSGKYPYLIEGLVVFDLGVLVSLSLFSTSSQI